MKKVAVVYWSGTGNTEKMAHAVVEGIQQAGNQADLMGPAEFKVDMVSEYDAIAFGCPAMGAEVLEEYEFEPMFQQCEKELSGKKLVLFGSYGWGTGEWMEDWEKRCESAGAVLVCDSVICTDEPDNAALEECKKAGSILG